MLKLTIDGSGHTGTYQWTCSCGEQVNDSVAGVAAWQYSPAKPIAESTNHVRITHNAQVAAWTLSTAFQRWVYLYWHSRGTRSRQKELA